MDSGSSSSTEGASGSGAHTDTHSGSSITRPPPQQKRPHHTKSKWQATWSKYHLKASKRGATYTYCTVCSSDFSVSGGGVHDVKRHCKSIKHTKLLKDIGAQPSISSSISSSSRPTLQEQVITLLLSYTSHPS